MESQFSLSHPSNLTKILKSKRICTLKGLIGRAPLLKESFQCSSLRAAHKYSQSVYIVNVYDLSKSSGIFSYSRHIVFNLLSIVLN